MKKTIILCAALPLLLTACNTMEGMGTDVQHGGQDLHNAAANAHDRMDHDDTDTDNHAYHSDDNDSRY